MTERTRTGSKINFSWTCLGTCNVYRLLCRLIWNSLWCDCHQRR